MLKILFIWEGGAPGLWQEALTEVLGPCEFRVHPDCGKLEEIDYVLAWLPPIGFLRTLPNLKAIFSIGAGASHILRDPDLPDGVPIVRLVDDISVRDMCHHAFYWVLHFHRNHDCYARDQSRRRWNRLPVVVPEQRRIGVLGLGAIGARVAKGLTGFGFPVTGWSRSPKEIEGVRSLHGNEAFDEVLAVSDILINMLPATDATTDILNERAFRRMPTGAYLINLARGEAIVADDLISALDSGQIAGAALDVFRVEPLPPDSPFWTHPKVFITPHAAGPTNQTSGPRQIANDILKLERGTKPSHSASIGRGY